MPERGSGSAVSIAAAPEAPADEEEDRGHNGSLHRPKVAADPEYDETDEEADRPKSK
jgi:hypothetical protein